MQHPPVLSHRLRLRRHRLNSHPLVDGNKRTAHVCYRVFLAINAVELVASAEEKYVQMLRLAEGSIEVATFADWVRTRLRTQHRQRVQEPR